MDFLKYLGSEEQNLLTSIANFRQEFDLFHNVDQIYQAPLGRLCVGEDEAVVPQLYLFVHFHLYFSVTCILRSHLSEALSSTRKAIDAALSAYALILDPDKTTAYLERDKYFRAIKANIQRRLEKDESSFPLARELLNIHGKCSEFGSHADVSSFFHRLQITDLDEKNSEMLFHYFQFPANRDQYRFYIGVHK